MQNRMRSQKGVTLVEVMIALVILLIVFIGLIQASLLTIQSNVRNLARDEAVRITADQMDMLRAASFDNMNRAGGDDAVKLKYSIIYDDTFDLEATPVTRPDLRRRLRGATVDYTVTVLICADDADAECALLGPSDADHKTIQVTTGWSWQGETFTHRVVTVRIRA